AAWWPNFDTPLWGAIFRNTILLDAIDKPRLGRGDLEMAAWTIARRDASSSASFLADFRAVLDEQVARGETSELTRYLRSYDGWNVAGSAGALLYDESVKQLRKILFQQHVGTFLQANLFERILQPTVIRRAMRSETKYDYLAGREPLAVLKTAMSAAYEALKSRYGDNPAAWSFSPGAISVPGQASVPYINRGTYIQVIELSPTPVGRNVASPGVAESGDHSFDQVDLARSWTYKKMWGFRSRQ
ncbi:MAG: penicillin acylase family protein, partial [Armatimonadetes bacterium]|nr:penicillin acylase family protein [Armatimonadota bacterium]